MKKYTEETYERKEFDFKKHGAFFAFWDDQFEEQKEKWVDYVSLWMGLVAPKNKYKKIIKLYKAHNKKENERRKKIEGIDKIIEYEYNNHECGYTWSIADLEFLVEEFEEINRKKICEVTWYPYRLWMWE